MRNAILVIALVLMAYLIIDFNSRTAELNYLTSEAVIVEARLTAKVETKQALQTQIAYATSVGAVEEYGYNSHLARPGDVRVIPRQPNAPTPAPTSYAPAQATEVSNPRLWWWLFFGPPTPAP